MKTFFALLALCLALPVHAGEELRWHYTWKPGQIYTYQIISNINFESHTRGILIDPETYEYTFYPGEIHGRRMSLNTTLEFHVEEIDKKGNAKVKAWFTDLTISAGVKKDEPKINGVNVTYKKGEWANGEYDTDNEKLRSFKAVLPPTGGFIIKGKMPFMPKAMGKFFGKMKKADRQFAKRHKEMQTTKWWQQLLNMYFIDASAVKFPGAMNVKPPLFLGSNHGVEGVATDEKKGCPMLFNSLTRNSADGCLYMAVNFKINETDEAGYNTTQLFTRSQQPVSYVLAPEGHLKEAPLSTLLYSKVTGGGAQITLQTSTQSNCTFRGMRDAPTED